jgi:hypothetical protein
MNAKPKLIRRTVTEEWVETPARENREPEPDAIALGELDGELDEGADDLDDEDDVVEIPRRHSRK